MLQAQPMVMDFRKQKFIITTQMIVSFTLTGVEGSRLEINNDSFKSKEIYDDSRSLAKTFVVKSCSLRE